MSLRARGLLYLALLHLAVLALAFSLLRDQLLWLLVLEVLLLASLVLGLLLINRVMQPMQYAQQLKELLQEKNYATRIKHERNPELGTLVDAFNTLLGELYQERLHLGEQRGFLQSMLEATPSAVVVFDFDLRISLLNASANQLLGLHAPLGQTFSYWLDGAGEFVAVPATSEQRSLADQATRQTSLADQATRQTNPADQETRQTSIERDLADAQLRRCKLDFLRQVDAISMDIATLITDQDGRVFRAQRKQFIDRGFARQFLLIDEITAELKRSEKATYEKLVRVLAHEVNNTVAVTGSVLDSLLYYAPQIQNADREDFATAIEAAKRRSSALSEFIERFTGVVKMPDPVLAGNDINALLDDIAALYRSDCNRRGIALEWQPNPNIARLEFDWNLISQALINIVKNAIEALASQLALVPSTSAYVRLELELEATSAGKRVRLSVIDSADALALVPAGQLFSAFFSTKKGGQGIGLMFVREVLQRHGFAFRLVSIAKETRFDVWLACQPAPTAIREGTRP
jgi:two-component system nitrogen regulation sensor histidine kinase NtrY